MGPRCGPASTPVRGPALEDTISIKKNMGFWTANGFLDSLGARFVAARRQDINFDGLSLKQPQIFGFAD